MFRLSRAKPRAGLLESVCGPQDPLEHELSECRLGVDLDVVAANRIEASPARRGIADPNSRSRARIDAGVRNGHLAQNGEPRNGRDVLAHLVPLVGAVPWAGDTLEDGMQRLGRFPLDGAARAVAVVRGEPRAIDVRLE